jgi:hypothetical protein
MVKKIISAFLLLTFCCGIELSIAAYDDFPLEGPEWEKKSFQELFTDKIEEGFLALYKITEENLDSEKAFRAFKAIRTILPTLKTNYDENKIKSDELRNIIGELIKRAENPMSAKDFFYIALFEVPKNKKKLVSQEQYNYYQFLIRKFPDTVYAEFSFLFMANISSVAKNFKLSSQLLTDYLKRYGKDGKLRPHVYHSFATMYYKLFKGKVDDDENYKDPEKKIAFMLEYIDRLYDEYPKYQYMIGAVSIDAHMYYYRLGEYDKAQEYLKRIYESPDPSIRYIAHAVYRAIGTYKKTGDVKKQDELLEFVKENHFNNLEVRELYKEFKLNVIQITRFGYDSYETNANEIYEKNKAAIDSLKALYESCWDADFNITHALPK